MKNLIIQRAIKGAALAMALLGMVNSSESLADSIKEAISGGTVSLNARARYEYIDGQGGAPDVNGYSIRTRLGLASGSLNGFQAMLELEDLSFNDPDDRPGLDVPTTEINQLWVSYKGEGFSGKLGNQVFVLDDHRFIGHVGWRQNIQTFDALTSQFSVGGADVTAAYVSRVNRVNATSQDLDGFIANGSYALTDSFKLTGFAYILEFDNWAPMSTNTFGVRGSGSVDGDGITYAYNFSYANQTDAGINPASVDLSYIAGDFSAAFSGVKLTLGYESLEGDGTSGFTTPLATVHKFNGFADVFAGRSIGLAGGLPQGLDDLYVSVGFKAAGIPLTAFYHKFETENGGVDLGDEFDLVGSYKLNEYTTLVGKYAYYEAEGGNTVGYGGADASVLTLEANLSF